MDVCLLLPAGEHDGQPRWQPGKAISIQDAGLTCSNMAGADQVNARTQFVAAGCHTISFRIVGEVGKELGIGVVDSNTVGTSYIGSHGNGWGFWNTGHAYFLGVQHSIAGFGGFGKDSIVTLRMDVTEANPAAEDAGGAGEGRGASGTLAIAVDGTWANGGQPLATLAPQPVAGCAPVAFAFAVAFYAPHQRLSIVG